MDRLTQGLALVNFRREPIYLSDDSLEQTPKFHRYAIGCRKLGELRELRAAFVGRAIHSTVENWSAAVEKATGAAKGQFTDYYQSRILRVAKIFGGE